MMGGRVLWQHASVQHKLTVHRRRFTLQPGYGKYVPMSRFFAPHSGFDELEFVLIFTGAGNLPSNSHSAGTRTQG